MIFFNSLSISQESDHQLVSWKIDHPKLPQTLWAKIYNLDEPISAVSAANWAALTLLLPAMRLGEAISTDGALDSELLFNMNHDLQSLLVHAFPDLSRIAVSAVPHEYDQPPKAKGVATAFSAGVDSFFTLKRYLAEDVPAALRISLLTTFNVGGLGRAANSGPLFQKYMERVRTYSKLRSLDWATIDSNVDDFYVALDLAFSTTATLRNSAAAMLLAGKLRTYLYSSSIAYKSVNKDMGDLSDFDSLIFSTISTRQIGYISAGAGESRLDKTIALANYSEAFDWLDVCTADQAMRVAAEKPNCSRCSKCQRTIIALDAIGALQNFEKVFDLEMAAARRKKAMKMLSSQARKKSESAQDILKFLKTRPKPSRRLLGALFGARRA